MKNNYAGVLLLPTESSVLFLDILEIVRIEASSNYSRLYYSDGSTPTIVAKTLGWFEQQPVLNLFVRIHRGHLINPFYIKNYRIKRRLLILQNSEVLPVSRRKTPLLKNLLVMFNTDKYSLPLKHLTEKILAA